MLVRGFFSNSAVQANALAHKKEGVALAQWFMSYEPSEDPPVVDGEEDFVSISPLHITRVY